MKLITILVSVFALSAAIRVPTSWTSLNTEEYTNNNRYLVHPVRQKIIRLPGNTINRFSYPQKQRPYVSQPHGTINIIPPVLTHHKYNQYKDKLKQHVPQPTQHFSRPILQNNEDQNDWIPIVHTPKQYYKISEDYIPPDPINRQSKTNLQQNDISYKNHEAKTQITNDEDLNISTEDGEEVKQSNNFLDTSDSGRDSSNRRPTYEFDANFNLINNNFNPFGGHYAFLPQPSDLKPKDSETISLLEKNYRDDKTHEVEGVQEYRDYEEIPKFEREKEEVAPISDHEVPAEIPTKPIYPGEGKWAQKGLKHRPFISHHKFTELEEDQQKPDGHEIFEHAGRIFDRQGNRFGKNLQEFPEKHKLGQYIKPEKEEQERDKEELNEESDDEENEEFVPTQIYSQVRRTEDEKHLPPVYEGPQKLREVIKDSKIQTVYSEEGYEDLAYDHAGHEKEASENEGFAELEEEIKKEKYKKPKLFYRVEPPGDSAIEESNYDNSKVIQNSVGNAIVSELPLKPTVHPNIQMKTNNFIKTHELKTTSVKDNQNGEREMEILSEVKILMTPNNGTMTHKFVKIYPKTYKYEKKPISDANQVLNNLPNKILQTHPNNILQPKNGLKEASTTARPPALPDSNPKNIVTLSTTTSPLPNVQSSQVTELNSQERNKDEIISNKNGNVDASQPQRFQLLLRRKRYINDFPKIEVDVDFIDKIKHILPNVEVDLTHVKYPYYFMKNVDKNSALKYAENLNNAPEKKEGELSFYEQAHNRVACEEVESDVDPIPDRVKNADKDAEEMKENDDIAPLAPSPRLKGLGDKIRCFKKRYFGENPLDSPFFREELVESVTPPFKTFFPPRYEENNLDFKTVKNLFEDKNDRKFKGSHNSLENSHIVEESREIVKHETPVEENEINKDDPAQVLKENLADLNNIPETRPKISQTNEKFKLFYANKKAKLEDKNKGDTKEKLEKVIDSKRLSNKNVNGDVFKKPKDFYNKQDNVKNEKPKVGNGLNILQDVIGNLFPKLATNSSEKFNNTNGSNSISITTANTLMPVTSTINPNAEIVNVNELPVPVQTTELNIITTPKYTIDLQPKHIYDQIELLRYLPQENETIGESYDKNAQNNNTDGIADRSLFLNETGITENNSGEIRLFSSQGKTSEDATVVEDTSNNKLDNIEQAIVIEDKKERESRQYDGVKEIPQNTKQDEQTSETPESLPLRKRRRKFFKKRPLYHIFDINRFLPTTPPSFLLKSLLVTTAKPETKLKSEVHYKDDIKPSEQLNVYVDVLKIIKNSSQDPLSVSESQHKKTVNSRPPVRQVYQDQTASQNYQSGTVFQNSIHNPNNFFVTPSTTQAPRVSHGINRHNSNRRPHNNKKNENNNEELSTKLKNEGNVEIQSQEDQEIDYYENQDLKKVKSTGLSTTLKPQRTSTVRNGDNKVSSVKLEESIDYIQEPMTEVLGLVPPGTNRYKTIYKAKPTQTIPTSIYSIMNDDASKKYKPARIPTNYQQNSGDVLLNKYNKQHVVQDTTLNILQFNPESTLLNNNNNNQQHSLAEIPQNNKPRKHKHTGSVKQEQDASANYRNTNKPLLTDITNNFKHQNVAEGTTHKHKYKYPSNHRIPESPDNKYKHHHIPLEDPTSLYQQQINLPLYPPLDDKLQPINKFYVQGMKPPPQQQKMSAIPEYIVPRKTHHRRLHRHHHLTKRDASKRTYTEVVRNRGPQFQKIEEDPPTKINDTDDGYVPHRPKNYHYDEKTGRIVYDNVKKNTAENEELIEYEDISEQITQTPPDKGAVSTTTISWIRTVKPKENEKPLLFFVNLLKSDPNYKYIPDPTTTERGTTTKNVETSSLPPAVSTTPPAFLNILAKVKQDSHYKLIPDKTTAKPTTTTFKPPVEHEEVVEESKVDSVQNAPGALKSQLLSELQIFDISEFLPKTKTYQPRTTIDYAKYKTIERPQANTRHSLSSRYNAENEQLEEVNTKKVPHVLNKENNSEESQDVSESRVETKTKQAETSLSPAASTKTLRRRISVKPLSSTTTEVTSSSSTPVTTPVSVTQPSSSSPVDTESSSTDSSFATTAVTQKTTKAPSTTTVISTSLPSSVATTEIASTTQPPTTTKRSRGRGRTRGTTAKPESKNARAPTRTRPPTEKTQEDTGTTTSQKPLLKRRPARIKVRSTTEKFFSKEDIDGNAKIVRRRDQSENTYYSSDAIPSPPETYFDGTSVAASPFRLSPVTIANRNYNQNLNLQSATEVNTRQPILLAIPQDRYVSETPRKLIVPIFDESEPTEAGVHYLELTTVTESTTKKLKTRRPIRIKLSQPSEAQTKRVPTGVLKNYNPRNKLEDASTVATQSFVSVTPTTHLPNRRRERILDNQQSSRRNLHSDVTVSSVASVPVTEPFNRRRERVFDNQPNPRRAFSSEITESPLSITPTTETTKRRRDRVLDNPQNSKRNFNSRIAESSTVGSVPVTEIINRRRERILDIQPNSRQNLNGEIINNPRQKHGYHKKITEVEPETKNVNQKGLRTVNTQRLPTKNVNLDLKNTETVTSDPNGLRKVDSQRQSSQTIENVKDFDAKNDYDNNSSGQLANNGFTEIPPYLEQLNQKIAWIINAQNAPFSTQNKEVRKKQNNFINREINEQALPDISVLNLQNTQIRDSQNVPSKTTNVEVLPQIDSINQRSSKIIDGQNVTPKNLNVEVIREYDTKRKYGGNYDEDTDKVPPDTGTVYQNSRIFDARTNPAQNANTESIQTYNIDKQYYIPEKSYDSTQVLKNPNVSSQKSAIIADSQNIPPKNLDVEVTRRYDSRKKHGGNYKAETEPESSKLVLNQAVVNQNLGRIVDTQRVPTRNVQIIDDFNTNRRNDDVYNKDGFRVSPEPDYLDKTTETFISTQGAPLSNIGSYDANLNEQIYISSTHKPVQPIIQSRGFSESSTTDATAQQRTHNRGRGRLASRRRNQPQRGVDRSTEIPVTTENIDAIRYTVANSETGNSRNSYTTESLDIGLIPPLILPSSNRRRGKERGRAINIENKPPGSTESVLQQRVTNFESPLTNPADSSVYQRSINVENQSVKPAEPILYQRSANLENQSDKPVDLLTYQVKPVNIEVPKKYNSNLDLGDGHKSIINQRNHATEQPIDNEQIHSKQKDVEVYKPYDKTKKHGGNYRREHGVETKHHTITETSSPATKEVSATPSSIDGVPKPFGFYTDPKLPNYVNRLKESSLPDSVMEDIAEEVSSEGDITSGGEEYDEVNVNFGQGPSAIALTTTTSSTTTKKPVVIKDPSKRLYFYASV